MQQKSKGLLLVALLSIVFIRLMYSYFDGVVIAKLPFQPASFLSGLTHYGLPGDNMRECSMTFIYILCNLTFGNYVKKVLALEGERVTLPQASPWG